MLLRRFFLSCLMGAVVVSGGFAEAQSLGERSSSGRAEVVAAGSRQGARPTGTSSLKIKSAKPSKTKAIKIPPPSAKSLRFMKKSFGLGSIKELRSFANTVGERCVLKIDLSQEHISCIPVAKDRSKHGFKFCQLQSKSPNKFPSCEVVPQMVSTKAVVGRKKGGGTPKWVGKFLSSSGGAGDFTIDMGTTTARHPDGFDTYAGISFAGGRPLGGQQSVSDTSGSNYGITCNPGEKEVKDYENCSDSNDTKCRLFGRRDVLKCVPECPEGHKMTLFTEECSASDNPKNCNNSDQSYQYGVKEVRRCASDPNYCPRGQHIVPTKVLCKEDNAGCTQGDDGSGNFYKTIPQCASKPPVNKRDTTCPKGNKVVTKLENCHPNDAGCSDQGYIEVKECKLDNEFRCPLGHKAIIKSQTCSQGDLGCSLQQNCVTIADSTDCEVAHVEQIQECVKDPDYGKDINGCKPGEQWKCDVEPCEYENGRPDPSGRCVPCAKTEKPMVVRIGGEQCNDPNYDSTTGRYEQCQATTNSCIADLPQGKTEQGCPDGKFIPSLNQCFCGSDKYVALGARCVSLPKVEVTPPNSTERPGVEVCMDTSAEYINGFCRCSTGEQISRNQLCPPKGPNEDCNNQVLVGYHPNSSDPIYLCECETGYERINGTCKVMDWSSKNNGDDKSWWDRAVSAISNTVKDIVSGLSGLVGSARDYGEEFFGSIRDRLSNIFGLGNTEQSGVGGSQGAGRTCPFGPGSHYLDPVAGWCGCPMGMEVVNGSCLFKCAEGLQRDASGSCS